MLNNLVLSFTIAITFVIGYASCGGGQMENGAQVADMNAEQVMEARIPPLDLAAPKQTETATFALG